MPVDLVRDATVEFDWSHVGVQFEASSQSEDALTACIVPIRQLRIRPSDSTEEHGVGGVPAGLEGPFRPFLPCFEVVLPTAETVMSKDSGLCASRTVRIRCASTMTSRPVPSPGRTATR